MIRATLVLRQPDRDADAGYVEEWAHETDVTLDELGVTVRWERGERTFFPWSAVWRVDFERCGCARCELRRAA